ncbi:extracellular catalytic domain type 1 short-chain-length polyhydroxyalkanoate depolymerase [Pararhizobium gei]|uniref:extracellular catalytic domain type 1 short-chain-length polyhydroxyalkanoate depolymerase n=1 Tax=Pararhizobium gei TaxID=1395951 RepID=UPI0023DCC64A|nr:PHB depolymerase family esterase [Rhizobium gei]
MRSMADTIERLARLRGQTGGPATASRLQRLQGFGSNPGALSAWYHVPKQLAASPPLVVVLHGCTQTASGYDLGSGWSKLADDYGFIVLFPEQVHANNSNLCFNWFNPQDIRRDDGEVLSIRQMIASVTAAHGIDERRIFITGLSAGGAMANAMLATYPEVFAGGAIIAGLPYATASTVPEAFDRMRGHGIPTPAVLQSKLESGAPHTGPWPRISIWHGTSDTTVVPAAAVAIVEQWRGVHGAGSRPTMSDKIDGHSRTVWRSSAGEDVIELYQISGLAHGTPLDVASGYGKSGPFMLDVGISSTLHIARSWGLVASFDRRPSAAPQPAADVSGQSMPDAETVNPIQSVIEKALRTAGLLR